MLTSETDTVSQCLLRSAENHKDSIDIHLAAWDFVWPLATIHLHTGHTTSLARSYYLLSFIIKRTHLQITIRSLAITTVEIDENWKESLIYSYCSCAPIAISTERRILFCRIHHLLDQLDDVANNYQLNWANYFASFYCVKVTITSFGRKHRLHHCHFRWRCRSSYVTRSQRATIDPQGYGADANCDVFHSLTFAKNVREWTKFRRWFLQ